MAEFLVQDMMNERGFVARPGRPKATQAAVALTDDGRVVYGDPKGARAAYANARSRLMYYDDEVERQRRLVCDTALGQLMLDNPKFAQPAVDTVSNGIESYWRTLSARLSDPSQFETIVKREGKYVSNATSFGRLPVIVPPKHEVDQFKATIQIWIATLRIPDLPQIMNLHDTFLKVYCSNDTTGDTPLGLAGKYGYREDWYNEESRGRANVKGFKQSSLPGLISGSFTIPYWQPLERSGISFDSMRTEIRNRGTDMFAIAAQVMRPAFRQILGENNLVFAASASGTTSTLLASARVFGNGVVTSAEAMKQYLMGCIAYLVGGGMHTAHEVFYTGGVAGLDYTPGKYLSMLPESFKGSRLFERWQTEFWELVRPDRPTPR